MSYLEVQGQQSMTLDERRNQVYFEAIAAVITPDSVVLDLGAGLGVHGLMAAQLGAKRVYLVEPEDIIVVAEEIAKANGFGDRVQCLQGRIEEVELPEPVDVIISVFTGNFLLEEDLLPSLFYARDKYLKPGGKLIPNAAVMQAVPVFASELYATEIEVWSKSHFGVSHHPARAYASQALYYYSQDLAKAKYLAEPASFMALDFYTATSTNCNVTLSYTIEETKLCHGWAGWFNMQLGETWLSTAPHAPQLHWSSVFLPLDPPLDLTTDEVIHFELKRPPFGDWYWRVKTSETQQQRSTFFATPMTLNRIQKAAASYQPRITPEGEAMLYLLDRCDGSTSIQSLSEEIQTEFPVLFPTLEKALQFVQNVSATYG